MYSPVTILHTDTDMFCLYSRAWSTMEVFVNQTALDVAMPIYLDTGCFHTRIAELSSYNRDCMAYKV